MAIAHTGNKITIHDGFTSNVTTSFTLPYNPYGLAWDGTNLIVGDPGGDRVYKYSGLSNEVLAYFSTTGHAGPNGVAWDGTNVLVTSLNGIIYKYDGFSSTILATIATPSSWAYGISWHSNNLFSTSTVDDRIYKHDGFSETILSDFATAPDSTSPHGISHDGTNILHTDSASAIRKVYKHNGESAAILDSFDTYAIGGVPTGVAWITQDSFTTSLQFKNASGAFASVTNALGDIGANIESGSYTCYWDDPSQDRSNVEISDARVQIEAVPDAGNDGTHSVSITSASQMISGDGTGSQGDVKVEYEIT